MHPSDVSDPQPEVERSSNRSNRSNRRRRRVWLALLLVVFGPYLFTRVAATFRVVRLIEMDQVEAFQPEASTTFRVLCYNIAHGRGWADSNWRDWSVAGESKRKRIEEIGIFLAEANADVVVLNEVDFYSTWSGHQNQARAIAVKAGYRYVVEQRNLDFGWVLGGIQIGNAILSRHPIVKTEVLDFPPEQTWESWLVGKKRGVLATLELPNDQRVEVAAIHLEHRGESTRVGAAELLLEIASRPNVDRLVLAGDFNSSPSGYPSARFDANGRNAMDLLFSSRSWQATNQRAPDKFTFPADNPKMVIDWVLVDGDAQLLPNFEVASDLNSFQPELSDHLPVSASISLKASSGMAD